MDSLVPIALFGWIAVSIGWFAALDVRRGILASLILGWLFLPVANVPMVGFPDYNKVTATAMGVLVGMVLWGTGELARVRPRWADLPIFVLWLSAGASSLVNGQSAYDALSSMLDQLLTWVVPYLAGRVFFRRGRDLHLLASAIVVGGLIYLPLCAYEIRMSPQLHEMVYGYYPHAFDQAWRGGGWRPSVFMDHGLMVGLWMSMAALLGIGLWRGRALPGRPLGVPLWLLVVPLIVIAVMCRSLGATVLLGVGVLAIFEARWLGTRLSLWVLLVGPSIYVLCRILGWVTGEDLVVVAALVDEERALSLDYRLFMENLVLDICREKPLLGWSSWGFDPPETEDGEKMKIVIDSYWMVIFLRFGAVGVAAQLALAAIPTWLMLRRRPRLQFRDPRTVPYGLLVLVLSLFMVDSMVNAMFNPTFVMVAGAVVGAATDAPAD
ncbi:MAG: O-antigen ligase domain-containing protein [Planctomycetota bacterium]